MKYDSRQKQVKPWPKPGSEQKPGYIVAMSGTHGTGKTTAAAQKFVDLKRNNPDKSVRLMHDLEADCPYPINQEGNPDTQAWLFANRIHKEMDNLSRFDLLVTDRTVVDIIAYTYVLGFQMLANSMMEYAGSHMHLYKQIYFRQSAHNCFWYDDGIRDAEDQQFRHEVEQHMLDFYQLLKYGDHIPGDIYYV